MSTATSVDAVLLLLIDRVPYEVALMEPSPFIITGAVLEKNHSTAVYQVVQTLSRGTRCDCKAFRFGGGRPCKHIRALRAVGLLGTGHESKA